MADNNRGRKRSTPSSDPLPAKKPHKGPGLGEFTLRPNNHAQTNDAAGNQVDEVLGNGLQSDYDVLYGEDAVYETPTVIDHVRAMRAMEALRAQAQAINVDDLKEQSWLPGVGWCDKGEEIEPIKQYIATVFVNLATEALSSDKKPVVTFSQRLEDNAAVVLAQDVAGILGHRKVWRAAIRSAIDRRQEDLDHCEEAIEKIHKAEKAMFKQLIMAGAIKRLKSAMTEIEIFDQLMDVVKGQAVNSQRS